MLVFQVNLKSLFPMFYVYLMHRYKGYMGQLGLEVRLWILMSEVLGINLKQKFLSLSNKNCKIFCKLGSWMILAEACPGTFSQ